MPILSFSSWVVLHLRRGGGGGVACAGCKSLACMQKYFDDVLGGAVGLWTCS